MFRGAGTDTGAVSEALANPSPLFLGERCESKLSDLSEADDAHTDKIIRTPVGADGSRGRSPQQSPRQDLRQESPAEGAPSAHLVSLLLL